MPGKVNPVIPEAVMMVAAQVVGNDATIAWADALGSNFDLNVMMPVIAYNLLQSIDLLTNAAQHLADKCVEAEKFLSGQRVDGVVRIEADAERCQELDRAEPGDVHGPGPPDRLRQRGGDRQAGLQGRDLRPRRRPGAGRARPPRRSRIGWAPPRRPRRSSNEGASRPPRRSMRLLDPHGQTVRGTGVGGPAGG